MVEGFYAGLDVLSKGKMVMEYGRICWRGEERSRDDGLEKVVLAGSEEGIYVEEGKRGLHRKA